MADRRVRLILEAQVDQFNRRMRQSRDETEGLGRSLREAVSSPEMQRLGRGLTAFGTATVGALGMATKSAIDWETAWIDVMRRTEGSPQQLEALEEGLRGIARELPTTHAEVAEVAASAAQLGVAVDDVEEFTRVMIDMGVSTNMTADQAATAMARFANIMGTPTEEMSNLGSAIVDLGNNSATTESEIMDMAGRLAGAGTEAGLSEGEVLGLAAAMSSLGLEAQAGGSALSRTMNTIGLEVDTGGEKLETFAQVAGMTSEEFSAAWRDDAASALLAFIEGLAGAEEQGTSMNVILEELGITAIRESDALRRLANGVDDAADSVARGNAAYEENTALSAEAAAVYESLASELQKLWSSVYDVAIQIGQNLAPALETMVVWLRDAVTWFAELPSWIQSSAAVVGALAGGVSLLAGGLILLAPGIFATVDALKGVVNLGNRPRRIIGNLGRAAGAAGATVGVLMLVDALARMADKEHDVEITSERIRGEFLNLGEGASNAAIGFRDIEVASTNWWNGNASTVNMVDDVNNIGDAMVNLGELEGNLRSGFAEFWGMNAAAAERNELEAYFESVDSAMSGMVSEDNIGQVAAQLEGYLESAEAAGFSSEELGERLSGTVEALLRLQNDGELTAEQMDHLREALSSVGEGGDLFAEAVRGATEGALGLGDSTEGAGESLGVMDEAAMEAEAAASELEQSLEDIGVAADGTIESINAFTEALFESGLATQSAMQAESAFEAQLDAVDDTVQQLTDSLAEDYIAKGYSEDAARSLAREEVNLGHALDDTGAAFNNTTDAGRTAEEQFFAVADSGRGLTQSLAENDATQDEVQGSLRRTYDSLIETGMGFGMTEDDARELTREVLGIPDDATIDSWMDDEAKRVAEETKSAIDDIDGRHSSSSHTHTVNTRRTGSTGGGSAGYGLDATLMATGGAVTGPGTGTSDDIPAMLSNGEHVLTARDVQAYGGQLGVYRMRQQLHQGPSGRDMVPRYANGGAVQARQIAAAMQSNGQAPSSPIQVEVTGEMVAHGNTMVGVVRNAMKDDRVVQQTSQSLQADARRRARA